MNKAWLLFPIIGLAAGWYAEKNEDECWDCGEHYSWDLRPINPYEDTIIITDPYEEEVKEDKKDVLPSSVSE